MRMVNGKGNAMTGIRSPAVAGMFYPAEAGALSAAVSGCLAEAGEAVDETPPKAVIAPHAGYVYSGPVAASAYARLAPLKGRISRVVLLGPAHRLAFRGLALPGVDAFATPLGEVKLDAEAVAALSTLPQVVTLPDAHAAEHSLEVHLPFLQTVLGDFSLVPLVVGDAADEDVEAVLETLWGGEETLIVVSSDLSHYHDYATAKAIDAATSASIVALDETRIGFEQACGRAPIGGLLRCARRRGMRAACIDLRSSGDTAGPRGEVVGYGAYVLR